MALASRVVIYLVPGLSCGGLPWPWPQVWWVTLVLAIGVVGYLGPSPWCDWLPRPWPLVLWVTLALPTGEVGYLGPFHWCGGLPWPWPPWQPQPLLPWPSGVGLATEHLFYN